MGFRTHFRDKQEWLSSTDGCMDLCTSSDEAAKEYDAVVSQFCGWYQRNESGGMLADLNRMLAADPNFLLGRALSLQLQLVGGLTAPHLNTKLASELQDFEQLVEKRRAEKKVNEHELLHAQVVKHFATNNLKQATHSLERLVTLYPHDVAALKLTQDAYFCLGQAMPMRHPIANSLVKMGASIDDLTTSATSNVSLKARFKNPLAGYAYGMFAFALEESNMYPEAQQAALKALELIPHDTWAIHNYAHCLEMQAKCVEGLKWMRDKQCDWVECQALACHQYWHTALFQINNNNFDEALHLLDNEVLKRCDINSSALDIHNASSMMYRMELVDLFGKSKVDGDGDVDKMNARRWSAVYDACKAHTRDHLNGFNDAHYMMSLLGAGDLQGARELIDSINNKPAIMNEAEQVVRPLLEAMYAYKLGQFNKCVELLEPIRYDIVRIGGSHAQRDVFEQLLLVAALKSDKRHHNLLAERMIAEREMLHGKRTTQTELLANAAVKVT